MKFSMFVTEDAIQVNLHPENDHERKFLAMLMGYEGPVRLHHGVDIDECKAEYLRNFGPKRDVLAITIHKLSKEI